MISSMSSLHNRGKACERFSTRVGKYSEVRRELRQESHWRFNILFDRVVRLVNKRATGRRN